MQRDVHILEYKYKKKKRSWKLYEGLNQNNQTNILLYVIFEGVRYGRLCLLFKTLVFRFL